MAAAIARPSDRLQTRILHFARQFDTPESDFWHDLDANPSGPLAAVLARAAPRQNVPERTARRNAENPANDTAAPVR